MVRNSELWATVVLTTLVATATMGALSRDDLSPAALALLPKGDVVRVVTTQGKTLQGEIERETETSVKIRINTGRMSYPKTVLKSAITTREVLPLDDFFAEALLPIKLDNYASMDLAFYEENIALFDEFISRCRLHTSIQDVRTKRNAFEEERKMVKVGMQKIQGDWYAPIAAAVKQFDMIGELMEKAIKHYPGVETDGFRGSKKVQAKYDELDDERRAIARGLPEIVTERIPLAIKTKNFDEAAEEVTAFLNFYLFRVIEAETGRRGSLQTGSVIAQMDFGYITRLERQIVEAYALSVKNAQPPAKGMQPGMTFIPGGYFLMGDEKAKPGQDNFPMRIIKLSPYLIDTHEVSNKAYREFVEHTTSTGDSSMEHPDAPPLKDHTPGGWSQNHLNGDDQPVVGVDWFDAYAYATWKGKRLPTEAEWEMAARSRDGRELPWDKDPTAATFVNSARGRLLMADEIDVQNPKPRRKQTTMEKLKGIEPPPPPKTKLPFKTWPANSPIPPQADMADFADLLKPTSPYGLMHLPGNVAEWVSDYYAPKAYYSAPLENPTGPEEGQARVYRGGSYGLRDEAELKTFRRFKGVGRVTVGRNQHIVGFRCAAPLP
ncbi:MAG: SUMF1/EgtB/PvdO family nonheme iron enzyme [Verrucomicrobia bacterium]|jgi:formylglycine-generating enzyme required for sulfatase activity|nr:SUMF1/EgtB/PvdO family nonheme iron enzyme [Verrucomicrobiota bacterium]MBT7064905.1 SUMF1/EgtB/PvdO family nonheme iron enzyme [Verrucomicrobiota bacterium]MBT7699968.1 SUMF1/EgtB/PvdO family nonheme iron enzyme [Verrucomicrobiota bacterium]